MEKICVKAPASKPLCSQLQHCRISSAPWHLIVTEHPASVLASKLDGNPPTVSIGVCILFLQTGIIFSVLLCLGGPDEPILPTPSQSRCSECAVYYQLPWHDLLATFETMLSFELGFSVGKVLGKGCHVDKPLAVLHMLGQTNNSQHPSVI